MFLSFFSLGYSRMKRHLSKTCSTLDNSNICSECRLDHRLATDVELNSWLWVSTINRGHGSKGSPLCRSVPERQTGWQGLIYVAEILIGFHGVPSLLEINIWSGTNNTSHLHCWSQSSTATSPQKGCHITLNGCHVTLTFQTFLVIALHEDHCLNCQSTGLYLDKLDPG